MTVLASTSTTVGSSAPSRQSLAGERAEVVAARALGCRSEGAAFARVETIVRALRQTGELPRARHLCSGILRALGDIPELPFSPALLVQEASACGDLEAARAALAKAREG